MSSSRWQGVVKGGMMQMKDRDIGIITFHCSDNYGAMLQAYGLKKYLNDLGLKADIVRYEPMFMVGRNWWAPYAPTGNFYKSLRYLCWGIRSHRKMGGHFFKRKANMDRFRKKYLVDAGTKKLLFDWQFRKLPYLYYVVGSDQIWNPDITFGLRKVYFGGFESKRKKRVIAYAASLGGSSLPPQYDRQFSELMNGVDVVSVREKEAAFYVRKHSGKKVVSVLDPVFLLEKELWQDVAIPPEREHYILVYSTEDNPELSGYVDLLSQKTGLPVIELKISHEDHDKGYLIDYMAGPEEFLGYIHKADYVVTNSFHTVAFSIIFEKKFMAFLHSSRGERIRNILTVCGLADRIYDKGHISMETNIDWGRVKNKIGKEAEKAGDFLKENISDGRGR